MALLKTLSLTSITGMLGRRVIGAALYMVDLTVFTYQALRDWSRRGSLFDRATFGSLITQLIFTGVDALFAITFLGIAVGLSITSQFILMVEVFGSTEDVVNVLSQVVALELGSLLTAIVLIGRSGSAIAVDLGNMKLNGEVEGLGLLGININHYFVTPRIISAAIAQMTLAVYFTLVAVISGILFATLFVSVGYVDYLVAIPLAFNPVDLISFLAKNLVFGTIIGAAACYHGLRVERSRTEVPQQAQRAIINSMMLVFLFDGLLALVTR